MLYTAKWFSNTVQRKIKCMAKKGTLSIETGYTFQGLVNSLYQYM